MDALEKLAERNRAYSNHTANDNRNVLFIAIYLLPVLITYFYTVYSPGEGLEINPLNALLPTSGAFILSMLLYVFVGLLILSHRVKVIAFLTMQCWFTYFWNSSEGVAFSLIPLFLTLIIFIFQFSKIKIKLLNDRNGI